MNSSVSKNALRPSRDSAITRSSLDRVPLFPTIAGLVILCCVVTQSPCFGQTKNQSTPTAATQMSGLNESSDPSSNEASHSEAVDTTHPASSPESADTTAQADITKELELLKARIEELERQQKARSSSAPSNVTTEPLVNTSDAVRDAAAAVNGSSATQAPRSGLPSKPAPTEPFAYADWTWLNGNARNKDVVWDSKFFTPEIRFDTSYVQDFNHPKDDTIGGSTEIFRSNEFQMDQISVGGDFHWDNVRGRILTMNGMFATTTPRNDASPGRGQWDLRNAYRYVSEAYGGYHFNVNHGLNIDAGIFVSYIGLFSYYNFDNWAYQPSYVSSNTPWFFNGLRIQWFPTDKLKIEPWIINGWQSYGRLGSKPGLGGQILWRPKPWLSMVFNNYGMGEDTLGNGQGLVGRSRIHTDDSVEIKYYDKPEKTLDKMAFSLTGDLGCEYGGGVSCHGNTKGGPKQSFTGWMLYNRFWFKKDLYAVTLGGGVMDNPGRYLTLLPPINGADAISGSPYFSQNPGDPFKAWDMTATADWMPKQYITFRAEYGYRHADVPYFTGAGGITPPGGNTGTPATPVAGWTPDLRKDEPSMRYAIMVKF